MENNFTFSPIGHIKSIFETKNGTPRQSGLSKYARATLTISKQVFTNPDHSLANLSDFSHVWLIWVFHADKNSVVKSKVAPPRLGGSRVGVFSTRSPHRPCNVGLSLAKIENIQGDTVHLSGVDMIDGTPVLDIKPFIPMYDVPRDVKDNAEEIDISEDRNDHTAEPNTNLLNCDKVVNVFDSDEKLERDSSNDDNIDSSSHTDCDINDDINISDIDKVVRVPNWVGDPCDDLTVTFTHRALTDLAEIDVGDTCSWLTSNNELKTAVRDILSSDPRSVYRKNKCSDRLYFTTVDKVHVTAWFDDKIGGMEVLRLVTENNLLLT